MKKVWCLSPQSGGIEISEQAKPIIRAQVEAFSKTRPWYLRFHLHLRFKNQFCYVDAAENDDNPFPLGRLRYFDLHRWSLGFYTYSNERYEPTIFPSGYWFGTIEEALQICEVYLN